MNTSRMGMTDSTVPTYSDYGAPSIREPYPAWSSERNIPLSKEEIDRMVSDAEAHADEDRKRREDAETRNQAETLVHQTEKFIADNDEKLPGDVKETVQASVADLKKALEGDDTEAIKSASEKVAQDSQALGQALYAQQDAGGAGAAGADGPGGAAGSGSTDQADDVVDADPLTGGGKRAALMKNAPQAEHGFFTVPKVIE